MLTDGRTDMTKLIVAFRKFANAPKSVSNAYCIVRYRPMVSAVGALLISDLKMNDPQATNIRTSAGTSNRILNFNHTEVNTNITDVQRVIRGGNFNTKYSRIINFTK